MPHGVVPLMPSPFPSRPREEELSPPRPDPGDDVTCGKPCHADMMAAVGHVHPTPGAAPSTQPLPCLRDPHPWKPVPPLPGQCPEPTRPGSLGSKAVLGARGEAGAWRALTWRCWRWRRSWPRWTPRRTWCISAAGYRRGGAWSYAPPTPPAPRGQDRATRGCRRGEQGRGRAGWRRWRGGGWGSDRWMDGRTDGWMDGQTQAKSKWEKEKRKREREPG